MDEGWKNNEIKKVENTTEDQKSPDSLGHFSREDREYLSQCFMELLKERKQAVEEYIGLIRGRVDDEEIERSRALMVFSQSLYSLIKDPRFPQHEKMILEVAFWDIFPKDNNSLDGVNMNPDSIKTIFETLSQILTPEVAEGLNAYAEKIFIEPFDQAIEVKE